MSESKRLLITGSSGFVGANLTRKLLKEGYEVHSILRETSNKWRIEDIVGEINVHKADISSGKSVLCIVKNVKPQIICHLAVYGGYSSQQDKQKMISSNVIGTTNLLQAAKKTRLECFINTGSSSEYGIKDKPMQETDCLEPVDFYGVSKAFSTMLCASMWQAERTPAVTLRLFSAYGYFEEPNRLIPYVVERCLKEEPIELASPSSVRDFVFVEDVVEAYLLAIKEEGALGQTINIGTGEQHSVGDVVNTVIRLCKAKAKPVWNSRPTTKAIEPKAWVADITKAKRILGWEPKHGLDEGLEKTIEWHRKRT